MQVEDFPLRLETGGSGPTDSEYSHNRGTLCPCGCGRPVPETRKRAHFKREYATDACRARVWNRVLRQAALDFSPPVLRVARPPHNPALVRRLCRAALGILGLLGDELPHSRQELAQVGGARYSARVGELRDAGHVILGPAKSPRHGLYETEPLGPGNVERYRLVIPG